jgi:hypothetical protein
MDTICETQSTCRGTIYCARTNNEKLAFFSDFNALWDIVHKKDIEIHAIHAIVYTMLAYLQQLSGSAFIHSAHSSISPEVPHCKTVSKYLFAML